MVFGVVPEPRHMDELEPFYRQHRLLGAGILIGGVVGLLLFLVGLFAFGADLRTGLVLSAAWLGPILFGLAWRTWGAGLMQARSARRLDE